jgi:hypothetical protein
MMWIVKGSVDIHAYMQCMQGVRLSLCADLALSEERDGGKIVKKKRGDDASMERRRYISLQNNKRDKKGSVDIHAYMQCMQGVRLSLCADLALSEHLLSLDKREMEGKS